MKPILVEIIAYAPTQYFHCQHCEAVWNAAEMSTAQKWHADMLETSIPPEMMHEYQSLSDWIRNTVERYGGRVTFRVVDAASVEGVWKTLRYGVRKYPAFVVAGKEKLTGTDFAQVEARINQQLASQPA